ncbi:MAG: asparagine synthase-related protein [Bacteroidales bacterium]|nr:asparagine synthase-related protein [Bacteroidales bacterium]MDD4361649.1 asparagine synthase-related protein [Bacteroidales bacterium]MDD4430278.1 asparagine synthase-related protein [Bacteroidales bacterium]
MTGFITSARALSERDFSGLGSMKQVVDRDLSLYYLGRFYNTSAAELLANFRKKGPDSFKEIDGDFLLLLAEKDNLLFYRDRHGAGSQLFYNGEFFSSHLIHFSSLEGFDPEPDTEALFTFLGIGYIPSPQTALKGVKKLSPGHLLVLQNGKTSTKDLYDYESCLAKTASSKLSIEEATEAFEKLHRQAIKDRIAGNTKVGLLLSGGYDSGGNIAAFREVCQGEAVSYSIGFKNNPWTELPLAALLSEKYGTRHYEYEIDGSEILDLPLILKATGDPFHEGGLMVNYCAMRLLSDSGEQPGIVLGGDGNDQHFGTSGKELALHWKLRKSGLQIFQKAYDALGNRLSVFEKDNVFFRTQFHNRKILNIQQSDMFGLGLQQLKRMSAAAGKMKRYDYLSSLPRHFDSFEEFYFGRNFNIDIKQVINEVILYKSSRMAELFGSSMSFPYMSTALYDFLNELPPGYKFKGNIDDLAAGRGVSKFLHKNCFKSKLPAEITERKKQGGFAPLAIFLQEESQRKLLFAYLRRSEGLQYLFEKESIESLLKEYERLVQSPAYWFWFRQVKANQLINLITLAVWWDVFIAGKQSVTSISEL